MAKYSITVQLFKKDFEKLIEKSGKTLTQIAKRSGITRGYFYLIINNKTTMTEKTWNKIKKVLNKLNKQD